MKTRQLLFIFAFFLNCGFLTGQEGILTGKITDAITEEALTGASIQIVGTTTGTVADIDGNFSLPIDAGTHEIKVSFVGYLTESIEVTVSDGEQVSLDIQLVTDLLGLDQIVITGVVNPKSALESSVALTSLRPKFIEELGAQSTAEIFRTIPGIRSESTGGEGNANIAVRGIPVASGGAKFLQLHEDGLPVMQFGDMIFGNADIFLRADLNLSRIEAIKGGSASTFASNSPAGIINLISKTGSVEGGTIGTTLGLDYNSFRTDFEYGSPLNNGVNFHIGGFFRQGVGPRDPGFTGNYGGQIKANLTKNFKKGYARVYFKYLNDRAVSYMPMPVKGTGTASDPTYESIAGYDVLTATMQSPAFLLVNSIDAQGNSRTSNIASGMNPNVVAIGSEFSFDVGDGWKINNKGRLAFNKGTFNSPFPAQIGLADDIATGIAGEGYTLSYATGANAGVTLTPSQIQNLGGNGLLMRIHLFDTDMDNMNNFTNDASITKSFDKIKLTAGYYKAFQRIAASWYWQTFLTDVSGEDGPKLVDVASADSSFYTQNGLVEHGQSLWGNCCTRGYDMMYTLDAPYANIEAELTPELNVDASIRYDFGNATGYYLSNYQAEVDANHDGTIEPTEENVNVLNSASPNPVNYDFKYVSFSVGANYKLADDMAVYARYSKGGRANADRLLYSPFITSTGDAIEGLSADEVNQAEVGFKYRSGVLSTIFSGFYITISEQNEEFGKAINKDFTSYGAELDAVASFSGLNIAAGATYTKAEIKKSLNDAEVGNVPRRIPDLIYSLSPSYTFAQGKASLGFSIIGTSKVYAQDDNSVVLPGYAYVNAFASVSVTKKLKFRVNSNNLTNAMGFTEMEGDAFVDNATNYLRARSISGRATTLTLSYHF
jgi:outer membrane receptor protein involved in Fe transport